MTPSVLTNLALVLVVAAGVTLVFRRLNQPVVLGYIIAGVIIGPHTPSIPLVADEAIILTLADLGVVLLVFSLGLDFNLRKLARVGFGALLAAAFEITVMVTLGYQIGRYFGWQPMDSLFLGGTMAITSSTIMIKVLREMNRADERFAHVMFGISIVEDILGIAMLGLLSSIAMTRSVEAMSLVYTLGRLVIFLTTVVVIGLLTVPPMFRYLGRFKSNETYIIAALGFAFGVSLLSLEAGYSVALGAFLSGAIVAESREARLIATLTEPVRDMFSAVFFVSIGMLIEPALLLAYAGPISVVACAVILGKFVSCSLGAYLGGNTGATSLRVGFGMTQVGEFSYIIAALGLSLNVTSEFLYPIAVSVSSITIFLMPYLLKASDTLIPLAERRMPGRITAFFSGYHDWMRAVAARMASPGTGPLVVRRILVQVLLNLALVAGLFLGASYVARQGGVRRGWWDEAAREIGGVETIAWLSALLLSMPILVALFRKINALGLIAADISAGTGEERSRRAWPMVRSLVTLLGYGLAVAWIIVVSGPILPPVPVLVLLILAVGILSYALWHSFTRLYARGQVALRDILSTPPAQESTPSSEAMDTLLADAGLEMVTVEIQSRAAGRTLQELHLRANTGATVIAVQREAERITNPPPDMRLLEGDQVLLMGTAEQLERARAYFTPVP